MSNPDKRPQSALTVLFSEASSEWRPLPQWADFLIKLGFLLPKASPEPRRIALISMPCDSAGAGLIAFGALVSALGDPTANDIDGHYDALLRHARQYLEDCRDCDMRCRPREKRCGYTTEANGKVRRKGRESWEISDRTSISERRLVFFRRRKKGNIWWQPNPQKLVDWQVEGEAPPRSHFSKQGLSGEPFRDIVPVAKFVPENLRRSFSGHCLAGRVLGERATREVLGCIRFRCHAGDFNLCNLLTIKGWGSPTDVSRLTFFNARTQSADRRASRPGLIIADGDQSFLRVLARPEFQYSDIVGVFHRMIDRDRLEAIGNAMIQMRQWYVPDSRIGETVPPPVRGIQASFLIRKGR